MFLNPFNVSGTRFFLAPAIPGIAALIALAQAAPLNAAEEKTTFQDHVLPIIENNCAKCHNPDKKKGDLDLTSYNGVMKGGGSGAVVLSGNTEGSKLYRAVTHAEDPTMPPNKPRLPDKELDVFKRWIAGGLLESSGSKAVAASKPTADLTLKVSTVGKPDGPAPMPGELPADPVLHTTRATAVTGLAGSPWSPLVAVTGQKQVFLYHSQTLELLGVLPYNEGQPVDLKFSRSGKLLVAGGGHAGKSGRVVVWDVSSGERMITVGEEYDTVLAADVSPDQSKIALGGPGRMVKIYSTQTGEMLHRIKKHTDWVNALAFSPNGEMLASADRNGGIAIWEPENGQELFTLAGHKGSVTALSWRGDSKILASSSEDGTIKLWELTDGKQTKSWNAHSGGALALHFTHDGRLVSCGRDNQVALWDPNGSKTRTFEFPGELPDRVVFSHDGSRIFAADWTGKVTVWETDNKKAIGELSANPAPLAEQLEAARKKSDLGAVARLRSAEIRGKIFTARHELASLENELKGRAAASGIKAPTAGPEKLSDRIVAAKRRLDELVSEYTRLKSEQASTGSSASL